MPYYAKSGNRMLGSNCLEAPDDCMQYLTTVVKSLSRSSSHSDLCRTSLGCHDPPLLI
jgi:hypothetical protein